MRVKATKYISTIVLTLLFSSFQLTYTQSAYAQDEVSDEAVELFMSGNFEEALPLFQKKLSANEDDPLLNYYCGACLIETGIFTSETDNLLKKAIAGNTPDKIYYYVGRYFQEKQMLNSALKFYNRFKNYGSDEEKKELKIEKLIDLCYQGIKPQINNDSLETAIQNTQVITDTPPNITGIANTLPPTQSKPELINFQVNDKIYYTLFEHFRTPSAKENFISGEKLNNQLQSVLLQTDSLRQVYNISSQAEKQIISEKIISLETESLTLNAETDNYYLKARQQEEEWWLGKTDEEINIFISEVEETKEKTGVNVPEENREIIKSDNLSAIFFDEQSTPIHGNKDTEEEDEIVYKIQIGAFSRGLPGYIERLFNKLALLRKIDHYSDDKGVVVYTTGNLSNFDDAIQMQKQVRQEGVKDAFVVAYKNGQRITIKEAIKLQENL